MSRGHWARRRPLHPWDLTPREAVRLQRRLAGRLRFDQPPARVERLGGVDVSYLPAAGLSLATAVVLHYPGLELEESAVARLETPFPYVPGLLSFREIPPLLAALEALSLRPDLLFVDGQGRAHPRRFGIACHLGLWLGLPTIGVAKSRLCGRFRPPAGRRGSATRLLDRGEVIGKVVRTRTGVRPLFISQGYGLSLQECQRWVLASTRGYRLPEPVRQADLLSRRAKSA